MNQTKPQTWSPDPATREILEELRDEVGACMQCGTCTASCPNGFAMDVTPRQMWRMVQFGMLDRILESTTFWMCSSCYMCTLRCPRGLKLTRAMGALKRLARRRGTWRVRKNSAFYDAFMENIEKYGRVQETSLMPGYFLKSRDPLLPLHYLPLGVRMMRAGKLHTPNGTQKGRLKELFAKVREMEEES